MDEEANSLFISLSKEKGWESIAAKGKQDYEEHWDWKISKENISYKIDLKSLKRVNSNDTHSSDQLMLIELQAVKTPSKPERKGWLYGQADCICFETNEGFVFIPRSKLVEYVESHIDINAAPAISNQNKIVHKIYTRRDRNDKFVYFYKTELLPLAIAIWRKHV